MKKQLIFSLSLLVLAVGFSGCSEDAPEVLLKTITVSPDEVSLTIGSTQQVTVTLSPSDATNANLVWNSVNESVATVSPDGLITAQGIGSTRVIVRSQASTGYITAEVQVLVGRAFSLLLPADDTTIVLNHKTPDDVAITFSWKALSNATSYDLLISYNSDLSNPLNIARTNGITATQVVFGNAELQTLIQQRILQKRYIDNTLYWNVKETSSGRYVGEQSRILKLSGYRQFIDERGTEEITYDVSVIPYDGKQHVWLSQNLRTAKAVDGTSIEDIPVTGYTSPVPSVPITAPLDWAYADLDKVKSLITLTVPASMEPYLGNWYANLAIDIWRDHLVPAGWKIPTWDEMKALFDAAREVTSDIRVLKNINGYNSDNPDETWNSWNMNIVPNGCGNWHVCPNFQSGWGLAYDYQGIYFMTDDGPGVTNIFDSWEGVVNSKWGADQWNGLPVRLLYIGDE
jgi:hypothetical protein